MKATTGIKALAHITGGGFPENIPRVLPETCTAEIDLEAITVPPVFALAGTKRRRRRRSEMLRTFNCGIGMIIVVAAEARERRRHAALRDAGEAPVEIGRLIARGEARVTFKGRLAL